MPLHGGHQICPVPGNSIMYLQCYWVWTSDLLIVDVLNISLYDVLIYTMKHNP